MALRVAVLVILVASASCASSHYGSTATLDYCRIAIEKRPTLTPEEAIRVELESRDWSFDDPWDGTGSFTSEELDRFGDDWEELGDLCDCADDESQASPAICESFDRYLRLF